jgi:hypothetical protein
MTADGQRFLVNVPSDDTSAAHVTLVMNWTADVKR